MFNSFSKIAIWLPELVKAISFLANAINTQNKMYANVLGVAGPIASPSIAQPNAGKRKSNQDDQYDLAQSVYYSDDSSQRSVETLTDIERAYLNNLVTNSGNPDVEIIPIPRATEDYAKE